MTLAKKTALTTVLSSHYLKEMSFSTNQRLMQNTVQIKLERPGISINNFRDNKTYLQNLDR